MHRYWNDGWSGGWWWMTIMMLVFWGGLIWIVVTFSRHSNQRPGSQAPAHMPTVMALQTPQEILAERLARGEIQTDEYRQRLDVLDHRPSARRTGNPE